MEQGQAVVFGGVEPCGCGGDGGTRAVCKWSRFTGEELSQLIKDTDNIAVTALK